MNVRRITVLISGNGSNLQALIDACGSGRLPVEIVHVISNRANAAGLGRATSAGIPTSVLEYAGFHARGEFDHALAGLISAQAPDLVVLAGFMRILGPAVLEQFKCRMVNLHPSLLPRYRGTDTCRRAIEAGDVEHGASMHFVTAELDGGPVISQVRVSIRDGDDAHSLMARLAPREHELVVATIELFSRCSVQCADNAVIIDGQRQANPLLLNANGDFSI
ncbi:MAG TPA: phosphoribosylglycinamide formyltransferase [Xanthomonadales bacterium]|nr:phosphoribosylglycinamide formyltransferase [Xanthomonadales bacterium]